MKAEEKSIDWQDIEKKILHIKSACESLDTIYAMRTLKSCVDDWKPSSKSTFYLQSEIEIEVDSNSDVAEC